MVSGTSRYWWVLDYRYLVSSKFTWRPSPMKNLSFSYRRCWPDKQGTDTNWADAVSNRYLFRGCCIGEWGSATTVLKPAWHTIAFNSRAHSRKGLFSIHNRISLYWPKNWNESFQEGYFAKSIETKKFQSIGLYNSFDSARHCSSHPYFAMSIWTVPLQIHCKLAN